MGKWKLAGSTAIIALLAGTGAFADVTPEEVWQNWQDMSASYGQTITAASATRDGDALLVKDATISYDKDGVALDGKIPEMTFTDKGDGTVEVTMSDSYPLNMTLPGAPSDGASATPTKLTITVGQPGMTMKASGTPEAISYAFNAPTLDISVTAINGVDAAVVDATIQAVMTNVVGNYMVEGDASAKKVGSTFSADSAKVTVVGTDKETSSDFNLALNVADLAGTSNGTFLGADAMQDMAAALKAGFAFDSAITYGAANFDMTATEADKPTKVSGTFDGGDISFAMDVNHLQYGAGSKKVAFTVSSPDIPFPELKLGYDEAAFKMLMPVSKSDQPADFSLLTRLVGFTISDEIWGMVDPTGALPHDPATVILDAKGKATLTADLMDAAAMETAGDASPFQLNALDINALQVSAVGAELTGMGGFTFDNTDMTTFEGIPAPTGKIDLKLTGANALLDKIVAMGLISQDDAMGYKMMVSMFANATPDKDEMTSTLEFKDKGFYANGQRLQ